MAEDQGGSGSGARRRAPAPIVNNLTGAPTIFIDGMQGLAATNGVIKINGFQVVQEFNAEGSASEEKRVIVVRLAMSPTTLAYIVDWLGKTAKLVEVKSAQPDNTATGDGRNA